MRILIPSVPAGGGHDSAQRALVNAFNESNKSSDAEPVEVTALNTVEFANSFFRWCYCKAYLLLVNYFPNLLGLIYDQLDEPGQSRPVTSAIERASNQFFWRQIDEVNPDYIVNTHFLPAELVTGWRKRDRVTAPQATVVTDLDAHALWLNNDSRMYFVAIEETRQYLMSQGVSADRIMVTGIPIDPSFRQKKDKLAMRAKHGLVLDKTTILVSGGGFGVGPVASLVQELLKLKHEAQIVVICANNKELKQSVEQMAATAPAGINVVAVGYTTVMAEWMAASDLIVGKPGGLTTSEALSQGLGFVIVNPIPGQEARNSNHLLQEGAAIRPSELETLAWNVDQLLADPDRLAGLQKNALRIARPNAAFDIVATMRKLVAAESLKTAPAA